MASRPALRAIPGGADPRAVSLLSANAAVQYWEATHDELVDALLRAPACELSWARFRLLVAHEKLLAAEHRRDRIECEMAGQAWLRLVEATHG